MKDNFFSDRLLLITPYELESVPDNVDTKYGTIKELFVPIVRDTFKIGKFYNQILIVNDKETLESSERLAATILSCSDIKCEEKDVYFKSVTHDGLPEKCTVDSSIILCNTWSFQFIANSSRRTGNLYEDCYSHRLTLKKLPIE